MNVIRFTFFRGQNFAAKERKIMLCPDCDTCYSDLVLFYIQFLLALDDEFMTKFKDTSAISQVIKHCRCIMLS